MSELEQVDLEVLLEAISSGHTRARYIIAFAFDIAIDSHSEQQMRAVDRALQKARRAGLISFHKGAWKLVTLRPAKEAKKECCVEDLRLSAKGAFVEEAKRTGLVASLIKKHNVTGLSVAPPA